MKGSADGTRSLHDTPSAAGPSRPASGEAECVALGVREGDPRGRSLVAAVRELRTARCHLEVRGHTGTLTTRPDNSGNSYPLTTVNCHLSTPPPMISA